MWVSERIGFEMIENVSVREKGICDGTGGCTIRKSM